MGKLLDLLCCSFLLWKKKKCPWKVAVRLEIMDTEHLEHNSHSIIAISKIYPTPSGKTCLLFLAAVG